MRRIFIVLLLTILCSGGPVMLSAPWGAAAATYYVDQGHPAAGDTGPGTSTQPWKTIQKAANTLVAGDTVIVKAGTYKEQVGVFAPHAGTPGNLITFKANPGDRVIINGEGTRAFGFRLGASYIRVEGFEIVNVTGHGILAGWSDGSSNGVEIVNNSIHDCGNNPDTAAVYYAGGANGLIQGNHLYGNAGDGITFSPQNNITIRGNSIHDNGVDGMKGGGGGTVLIEGNVIHTMTSGVNHGDCLQAMGNVGTLIIRNNAWWDCTQDIYLDTYGGPQSGLNPWGDVYIYNNVVYNTQAAGSVEGYYNCLSIDNRWNKINSITVYQNTFVDCNNGGGAGGASTSSGYAIGTLRVANNLYYNSITSYTPDSATNLFVDYNVYYNPIRMAMNGGWYMAGWITLPVYQTRYPALEQHSTYSGIGFVRDHYPDPEFRLVSGSPAIDGGTPLGPLNGIDFGIDADGVRRPQGAGWDLGAYEYVGGVNAPPSSPKTLRVR